MHMIREAITLNRVWMFAVKWYRERAVDRIMQSQTVIGKWRWCNARSSRIQQMQLYNSNAKRKCPDQRVQPKQQSHQSITMAIRITHGTVRFTIFLFAVHEERFVKFNAISASFLSEGVIISSKINDFEQLSYETKENYHVYSYAEPSEVIRCETSASSSNHMSIVLKSASSSSSPPSSSSSSTSSSISNAPVHETSASLSSSSIAYKSNVQSVIQSTCSTNGGNCIQTPMNAPTLESSIVQHNHSRSHSSIHDSNANYPKNTSTLSNQYFVFRSGTEHSTHATTTTTTTTSNPSDSQTPPTYRERSIEETEAAHDLLSLSQSLPPLPAPCVVTILHPVTNYKGNSPDVQEITANRSNNEYITYTSGRTIQYTTSGATGTGISGDRSDICTRNKKHVSTQFDGDMLPEDSFNSGELTFISKPTENILLNILEKL